MTVVDEIKDTLCRNITLHERLRDIIKEECVYIENNEVGLLPDKSSQKREIEQEIDCANQAVMTFFEQYYGNSVSIHTESQDEIGLLVKKLRESIHDTVVVIGNMIESIKKTRKDIVCQLRDFDNNKNAINAYAKTKFH